MKLYTENEKRLIGKYFRYIRKIRKIKLREIYLKKICGHSTYHDIERGIPKSNDDYYDLFLEFYDLNYNIPTLYIDELDQWYDDLFEACMEYDIPKMKQHVESFNIKYQTYRKHLYIQEIFETINFIVDYYSNNTFLNKQRIENLLPVIELFDNKYGSILIEVCEQSNFLFVCDYDLANQLASYLNDSDFMRKYWYGRNLELNSNYLQANEIYQQLLLKSNHYFIRETRVLLDIHSICRDIDLKKADEIIVKLNERVIDDRLPLEYKRIIYHNLGMHYYLNHSYSEAVNCYRNEIKVSPSIKAIIFLSSSLSHLDSKLDPVFDLDINKNYASYPYYLFYKKMYENKSKVDLEDYILNEMMENLKKEKYKNPYWNMFEYEMRKLNSKTSNYKKLNTYLKLREKYLKSGL